MEQNGKLLKAIVLEKSQTKSRSGGSLDNQIHISFAYPDGNIRTVNTAKYISTAEYDALQTGQTVEVLYNPKNDQVYYNVSFHRYLNDQWFMYFFPASLFLIGAICGIVFRKYKVGVHEDTGDEYLEKDGKIYLDEKDNQVFRTLKHVNIISKMFRAFR